MAFQFPPSPILGQRHSPATNITYEWDGTGWVFVGTTGSGLEILAPPGIILPYAGNAPLPFAGWVLCDGKSYATTGLPALFAVIGYSYGGSGGSFNVPDLRGRVIAGVDNMGGAASGRLTTISGLGGAGGQEQVQLTQASMPAHTHGVNDPSHTHGGSVDGDHTHGINRERDLYDVDNPTTYIGKYSPDHRLAYTEGTGIGMAVYYGTSGVEGVSGGGPATTGISIASAGGAGGGVDGHLNVQPTLTLNYIVKT